MPAGLLAADGGVGEKAFSLLPAAGAGGRGAGRRTPASSGADYPPPYNPPYNPLEPPNAAHLEALLLCAQLPNERQVSASLPCGPYCQQNDSTGWQARDTGPLLAIAPGLILLGAVNRLRAPPLPTPSSPTEKGDLDNQRGPSVARSQKACGAVRSSTPPAHVQVVRTR
jgi:hypothetical protein